MTIALSLSSTAIRAVSAVSPRWGGAAALRLFAHVSTPRPVGADDEATMWRARRSFVRISGILGRGTDVDTYEWGSGDRTVVLAHGWDGRASQFATLVRDLHADGCRVVAFDAPAHGDSAGRHSYLVDWVDALAALQQRYGGFDAVVGHSFGGLAALVAAAQGVEADRIVTIAAPAEPDSLLTQFQARLRYSDATAAAMRARFARRYFPDERDPFARLSPVQRPLPLSTSLLAIHDERDRVVPFPEMARIMAVNPGARSLATSGLGHNRVLTDDVVLDAILEFIAEPVASPVTAAGAVERVDAGAAAMVAA